MKRLDSYWYDKNRVAVALTPLSWLFCALAALRRVGYRLGLARSHRLPVPVWVVGNITVGGSGKTPLVVWLAEFLRTAGYRPGIVSRGYGGRARHWPQQVRPDSDPTSVGDEAILIARRSGCPMAVGPDRAAAAKALLAHNDCDIILSDDGLQHYALKRDVEIAVIDGVRRFGNAKCLPAGPLREPVRRLRSVDLIVVNGTAAAGEHGMKLVPGAVRNLYDEAVIRPLAEFAGQPVHAVAGIGHPARFFGQLRRAGVQVIEHPFPDHHAFAAQDLAFDEPGPILMTEKDAVKCRRFARPEHWYLPVDAELAPGFGERLRELLKGNEHG